jgi:glycerophosphoryl diester phosphodiesterase
MLTLGLIAVSATAAQGQRPSEVACCVRDRNCHATFVVSHRARGFDAPEQSRQAIRRAIKAGVPVVEVDLRRSQDGELFLLHDEKLDRTTCHKGHIAGVASTEVAAARIKNGEFLPRFTDVYQLSRGVAMLDLHLKIDAVEQVAEWLDRHGSFEDVIFFADTGPTLETAARLRRRFPAMLVMPRVRSAADVAEVTRILGSLPPIVHVDFPTPDEVWTWHRRGVKVFAKATDFDHLPPPVPFLGLQTLLATAVDFVLTDDPRPLVARARNRRALGSCAVPR